MRMDDMSPKQRGGNAVERVEGPLRSRFPGELALRDLGESAPMCRAGLVTARFLTLQVAERYAAGWFVPEWLELAIAATDPYVGPGCESAPADAMRLRQVLTRMRVNEPDRVVAALIAAGDTTLTRSHRMAAYGFYRAAYVLSVRIDKKVGALSASSRLACLADDFQRPASARRWSRRCAELVAQCR
jgi:hypothetical protein